MPRTQRTVEELQSVSAHLYYEFGMLTTMGNVLATGASGKGPFHNALLESFVIHVRNVMDFLYSPLEARSDDVIAEDFLDDPGQWGRIRPPLSDCLSQAKRRAAKEVAHLTYARLQVTPEAKLWAFVEISKQISIAFAAFLRVVPKDRLSQEWQSAPATEQE